MGSLVKKLVGGGSSRKQEAVRAANDAQARQEQSVSLARQQQEAQAAGAQTELQLGRVRRTPRGRRALLGEAGSKLG